MSTTVNNRHILVFPYPAQGHMLPLLRLTHRLSLHGLTITIVITPKNLPYLSSIISSSITPLILPFPSHPSIPSGVENIKDLGHDGSIPMINALAKLHDPLLQWFNSHPTPPVAIISDFFLGWTHRLAQQLKIPRLAFFSSGAFFASIDAHLWNNVEQFKPLDEVELSSLPGSHVFKSHHLPSFFYLYKKDNPDWEFVKDTILDNTKSWGYIFNSFEALEGAYMDHLKKIFNHDRIFGVGPLNLAGPGSLSLGDLGSDTNDRVLTWLDGCPKGSVVYVCFGSQKLLKRDQMEALALGLEKSGTRFVWVVKTGSTDEQEHGLGIVPDGFEERVAGRGLVVKEWAPQVSILSHNAVGGFLSHCGWNSVLEAVVGGVMILAWPMEAEQFVNTRLLVEDMGVAIRVCEGADSVPESDELSRLIGESMSEVGGLKDKAKELKEKALKAVVTDGGSSVKDLVRLVDIIKR